MHRPLQITAASDGDRSNLRDKAGIATVLIEREPQLRQLSDAWNHVRAGEGRVALISGEADIGKTSLVRHFVSKFGESTEALWGACDALFSPQPLGPFLEIARKLQSVAQQLFRAGSQRFDFSTELVAYLQARSTPVIVVIEDLHWADEATLDVLKYLGRRIQQIETLLIVTYHDDEVNREHPLWFLLVDFPAQYTDRLALPPLSSAGVAEMARNSGRSAESLFPVTAGNPFFVAELLANEGQGLPPSVRDAILARMARLSPAAKTIVELTALMPGTAQLRLIEAILGNNPAGLNECVERGVL